MTLTWVLDQSIGQRQKELLDIESPLELSAPLYLQLEENKSRNMYTHSIKDVAQM